MKAIRLSVAFAIAWSVQGGVSYAAADWLDRLSGPGKFWGIVGSYRFLCVSKSQDQDNFNVRFPGTQEPQRTLVSWLSPIHRGSGILPVITPEEATSTDVRARQQQTADYNCAFDRRLRGYATTTVGWYWSKTNNLFPQDPDNDLYQVKIFRWTGDYAVRLHPALDVGAGAGLGRFSGDAFDSFSRWFVTPLSIEFSPAALIADTQKHRAVGVGFALTWFGDFDEQDFCTGANCAGIRNFTSRREIVPRFFVTFDWAVLR